MDISKKQTEQKIEQLLCAMERAVQDNNWFKVKEADKKMHLLLGLSEKEPWFDSIEPQRRSLKKRYTKIISVIAKQQSDIKVKMQSHQNNKEGIEAYKELSEGSDL